MVITEVQFINVGHQNEKPCEIYFWINNIYLRLGSSLFNIWAIIKFQRGLVNMAMM